MRNRDQSEATVSTRIVEGVPVVEINGVLDLKSVEEFLAAVSNAAKIHRSNVVVALGKNTYLDSRGIDSLIRGASWVEQDKQRLVVAIPRGASPRRIIEIAGLGSSLALFDSVEAAVAAARVPSS